MRAVWYLLVAVLGALGCLAAFRAVELLLLRRALGVRRGPRRGLHPHGRSLPRPGGQVVVQGTRLVSGTVASPLTRAAYGYVALLLLAAVAFWPRYLSRPVGEIDPYTHAHAAVALAWVFLLIGQPLLLRRHRSLHRRIGRLSYVLAPLFVLASLLLAHARFRAMDGATFQGEAPSLFLPLSAVALFGISYTFAIVHRHTAQLHGRFMIATGLPMIDPVLGRVLYYYGPQLANPLHYQLITFGLTDLILVVLLVRPALPRPLLRAFLYPALAFPIAHLAWFTVVQGPGWLPVASWFRSLPLP